MTLFAIVDKSGFKTGFNPRHHAFVDIAFSGLSSGRLDINVDQFLTVDDRDPKLFGMGRVEQHSLHANDSPREWA